MCDGGLIVPWPAGFSQEFLDLRFTCRGQPSTARPPADGNHYDLEYWGHADFDTLSLAFSAPKPVFGCADLPAQNEGFLLLGVRMVDLPLIATPQKPILGFPPVISTSPRSFQADSTAPRREIEPHAAVTESPGLRGRVGVRDLSFPTMAVSKETADSLAHGGNTP